MAHTPFTRSVYQEAERHGIFDGDSFYACRGKRALFSGTKRRTKSLGNRADDARYRLMLPPDTVMTSPPWTVAFSPTVLETAPMLRLARGSGAATCLIFTALL